MTALDAIDSVHDCTGTCSTCPAIGSCADRIVCRCLNVVEDDVIAAIRHGGARTMRTLRTLTGAGDGCRCCHRELQGYLKVYTPAEEAALCLS